MLAFHSGDYSISNPTSLSVHTHTLTEPHFHFGPHLLSAHGSKISLVTETRQCLLTLHSKSLNQTHYSLMPSHRKK